MSDLIEPSLIATRLAAVRKSIESACVNAGRNAIDVNLLAVSKTKPEVDISSAIAAGQTHFGENYLQEALTKIENLGPGPIWHFIGAIQSNKTRPIAEKFDWVHTVSSLKIARRLNEQRPAERGLLNIFVQVNIDEDPAKSGFTPDGLKEAAEELGRFEQLNIQGLMTIPRQTNEPAAQRQPFSALAALQEEVFADKSQLSMGMSADLEAAILEGATWVRIGTDIFGKRDKP